jgi:hypothetical protein
LVFDFAVEDRELPFVYSSHQDVEFHGSPVSQLHGVPFAPTESCENCVEKAFYQVKMRSCTSRTTDLHFHWLNNRGRQP